MAYSIYPSFKGSQNRSYPKSVSSYPNTGEGAFPFDRPEGLAIDKAGNLYVACAGNNKLYMVEPSGVVSEIPFSPAMAFTHLSDVAVSPVGELFVSDKDNSEIYRRRTDHVWDLFASGAHGLSRPVALGVDNLGSLYAVNENHNNVTRLNYTMGVVQAGVISGSTGGASGDADGEGTASRLNRPAGICVRGDGEILLADAGNHKIKKLMPATCQEETDPCETGECGTKKWHLDEVTINRSAGSYRMTDLDGYFQTGSSTRREEYALMNITEKGTAGAQLRRQFTDAYQRNYMVQLPPDKLDLTIVEVTPMPGSPLTATQMPLLRDNEPINTSEQDAYYLVRAVIHNDCSLSCEVEIEEVDCYESCEQNRRQVKQQLNEIREEIKRSNYRFKIGPLSLPFYKLIDHFHPFNDAVLNYLPDDKAQELYLQYASLKEFYAQFDMDMCVEGCQTGLVDAPPCTSCNSVFIDCAYEKADALLAGVEHMLNKWAESEVAGTGFPYEALDLKDANGDIVPEQRDILSLPLLNYIHSRLVSGPSMVMSEWEAQGGASCSNCFAESGVCGLMKGYDVTKLPTIVIPLFNTWVAECQSDFDRCMSLNEPLNYEETLWQQQIDNCLNAVGPEPAAAAYGPEEQAQYLADKERYDQQKADCQNLRLHMEAEGKGMADYIQRETMVMEALANIYPGDPIPDNMQRCKDIIEETKHLHLGDLRRHLMEMEAEQSCLNNCEIGFQWAFRNFVTDSIKRVRDEIRREYTQKCYGEINENFDISYKQRTYHYTLYSYDHSNRLVATIPPEGIDYINTDDAGDMQRVPLHMQADSHGSNNGMKSRYTHNSLFTLSYESPDEGRTEFFYDQAGRIRFSRDAVQTAKADAPSPVYELNYTLYHDETGRITEVGVMSEPKGYVEEKIEEICDVKQYDPTSGQLIVDASGNPIYGCRTLTSYIPHGILDINTSDHRFPANHIAAHYNNLEWAGTQDAVRREQTWYVYDQPQLELAGYQQKHTDGRLTKMYNNHGATYFSYDVHGRVVWAVQEINIAGQVKYLTVDYQYSALTSRVEQILYQKDTPGETFAHRYLYDADNRLVQVLVSRTPDNTDSWTKVAGYEYYLHGPLKNTQLGDYIQKVDYVYNLNGWLKAINNPAGGIMSEDDAVKGFASDVFAQALGYYEGDYNRAGTGLVPGGTSTTGTSEDNPPTPPSRIELGSDDQPAIPSQVQALSGAVNLYSGNISSSITRTAFSQAGVSNGGDVMAQTYRYDLLNRFVGSRAATGESLQAVSGMSGSDYAVTVAYDANSNITDLNRTMAQGLQFDQMTYKYATQVKEGQVFKLNNRLLHINDAVSTPDVATDMEDQGSFSLTNPQSWNYQYDAKGRVISNRHDGVALIEYNAYGKVKRVVPTDQSRPTLEYTYDATQQRLSKKVTDADGSTTATYYAYDAMGVPMATYTHQETGQASTLTLNDFMLYGSGRLGSYQVNEPAGGTAPVPLLAANLRFELTDHLGTVRAVVTGQKTGTGNAEIVSLTDYYPYGMDMPGRSFQSEAYRYGYQGSERDPEMSGGAGYTTYFRALDPRIGRWLTPDPKVFPWQSPYVSMDGNPVALIDPWGASTGGDGKKNSHQAKGGNGKGALPCPGENSGTPPKTNDAWGKGFNFELVFPNLTKSLDFTKVIEDYKVSERKRLGYPTYFVGNATHENGKRGILTDEDHAIEIMFAVGVTVEVGSYILEDENGGIVFYLMDYSGENSLPTNADNQEFKKNSRSIKVNGVKYKVLAQVHTHLATDGFEGPSIEDVEWSEKAGIPIFTIGKTDISKVDPGTHKVSNYQKYRWKLNRKKWINEENNGFKIDNTKDVRSKRKKITDSL